MWILLFCTCALIQCYDAKALNSTVLQTMLEDPIIKNCNSSLLDIAAAQFIRSCNMNYNTDIQEVDDPRHLVCLSYYDINRRLCTHKLDIPRNASQVKQLLFTINEQNISCESIHEKLDYGDLPSHDNYAVTLISSFGNIENCKMMCSTLKNHVNDFCKIFFWGNAQLSLLKKTIVSATPPDNTNVPLAYLRETFVGQLRNVPVANASAGVANPTLVQNLASPGQENGDPPVQQSSGLSANQNSAPTDQVITQPPIAELNHQLTVDNTLLPKVPSFLKLAKQTIESEATGLKDSDKVPDAVNELIGNQETKIKISNSATNSMNDTKVSQSNDMAPGQTGDVIYKTEQPRKESENSRIVKLSNDNKNPLLQPSSDGGLDYNVDENSPNYDEELQDNSNIIVSQAIGSGNNIPNKGDDLKVNKEQNEDNGKGYIGSLTADDNIEDGGHFFPMFLSLVGLSALIYILFHNKNKILGLLVEGRVQSTRRRGNHAYRRLDTLEHAVAAPPPPAHNATILY